MKTFARTVLAGLVIAVASGCADSSGPRSIVQARARFFAGATPSTTGAAAALTAAAGPPADGIWAVSPDKVTLKLIRLDLQSSANQGTGQSIALDCTVTYDKSQPGLTQIGDCPFVADTGTYDRMGLVFAANEDLLINDATNNFYSTATGVTLAAPAGGAQTFSFTVPNSSGGEWSPSPFTFATPITLTQTAELNLSVVVNGLQFFWVQVTNGQPSVTGTSSPQRPGLVAALGAVARVEYYVHQQVGTSGSYCTSFCSAGTIPLGVKSFALYYTNASTPAIAAMDYNGFASNCPNLGPAVVTNTAKSYIGLDASGDVSWAMPSDESFSSYVAEMRVQRLGTLGATTTLYCKSRTTDPAPAGGSYASGAPAINVAGNSFGTYVLVAK